MDGIQGKRRRDWQAVGSSYNNLPASPSFATDHQVENLDAAGRGAEPELSSLDKETFSNSNRNI